jgi:magnesium transporter
MSNSGRRRRKRKTREFMHAVNVLPGTVSAPPNGRKPELHLFAYRPDAFEEHILNSAKDVSMYLGKWPVIWLNVEGIGDAETILDLGKIFHLHELALEDCVWVQQRSKVDEYSDHLFVVMRMANSLEGHPHLEQLSMFLGKNFVLTVQEGHAGDVLSPVRDRIRKASGTLRSEGADYLLYAIIDALIDGYFPVVESLGDELEKLEDSIIDGADRFTPARVLEMKRDVLMVRRAIWPARDAVNMLVRDDISLISHKTRVYIRDCYDHAMRIIDLVETQRELCADLMDLYMSSVSNRMNEVMKVLTVITLLFMPATLIAGIYGMNFNTQHPLNMPELNWPLGYIFALSLMIVMAGGFYRYAYLKGWTHNELRDLPDNGQHDSNQKTTVEHNALAQKNSPGNKA